MCQRNTRRRHTLRISHRVAILTFTLAASTTWLQAGAAERASQATASVITDAQQIDQDAIIQRVEAELRARYVFPERAEQAAQHLAAATRRGDFAVAKTASDLAAAIDVFLAHELHDQHLHVQYKGDEPAPSSAPSGKPIAERYRDFERMAAERENFGVRMAAQLAGNIGYLRLSGFPDAAIMTPALASAITLLRNTTALIIDVRDNHGGDPQAVALLESYFFEPWRARRLNDIFARTPAGFETHQYWSTAVPTALYYDHDLYILTSARTISAGEGFSYEMQAEKRATVVGEVTAGAANPASEVPLGNGFVASIPFGRAVNPVTQNNWEGTGVHPDVPADASAALQRAYVMALTRKSEQQPGQSEQLRKIAGAAMTDPAGILSR